jgi:hypothetical protein
MLPIDNVTDPDTGALVRTGPEVPEVAVDPHNGNLYAVWMDSRFSKGQFDSIAFSQSKDGGVQWSTPIEINQTPINIPAGDQQAFTPSISVAANGTVAVTYYDFRFNDPNPGLPTDAWVVFGNPSGPGGLANAANWGSELRLTDTSFDMEKAPATSGGLMIPGEYKGLAVAANDFLSFIPQTQAADPASIFFRRVIAGTQASTASQVLLQFAVLTTTGALYPVAPAGPSNSAPGAAHSLSSHVMPSPRVFDRGDAQTGLPANDGTVWSMHHWHGVAHEAWMEVIHDPLLTDLFATPV